MRRTGWFTCSDERINALHEAARVALPRQRLRHPDRLPAPGAGRLDRRLAAVRCRQRRSCTTWPASAPSGWPTSPPTSGPTAPSPTSRPARPPRAASARSPSSTGGRLGRRGHHGALGDLPRLRRRRRTRRAVAAMAGWLNRAERMAATGRHPSRTGRRQPHERYLWDTGFHFGEWLPPGDDMSGPFDEFVARDKSDVATAYLARSAELMSRIADDPRPPRRRCRLPRARGRRRRRLAGRVHRPPTASSGPIPRRRWCAR